MRRPISPMPAKKRIPIMSVSKFLVVATAFVGLLAPVVQAQVPARPSHPAEFSPNGERFIQQGGENLYRAICQGCHMPKGEGAQGAGFYPALTKNPRLASSAYPTYVVLNGLRGMPPFAQRLSDQQVADVVNYVRSNFGNAYTDKVSPEDIKKARP